jgi:hypothetical protein
MISDVDFGLRQAAAHALVEASLGHTPAVAEKSTAEKWRTVRPRTRSRSVVACA